MQNRECIVFERTRDTGQRIHVCVFVSPVLILSSTNRRRGWIHLQHTRVAVAFARWSFLLFLGILTIKIPAGKCDSYTRMLQMNPPVI